MRGWQGLDRREMPSWAADLPRGPTCVQTRACLEHAVLIVMGTGATPPLNCPIIGRSYGAEKAAGPLSLVTVDKAGHMVPMDQPVAAAYMIREWLAGRRLAK